MLANDYLQLVNGYYLSTKSQVDGFKQNAQINEYADIYAMIEDFKKNSNSAVRTDAQQKEQTMQEFEELTRGLDILKNGNFFQKAVYMLSPDRWNLMKEVSKNFQPGIPLNINSFGYSLVSALVFGVLVMWPIRKILGHKKSLKKQDPVDEAR